MSFQGDVAGIGLGELLQGLARGGRDGVLNLFSDKISGCLGVRGGMLYLLPSPEEDEEHWRERSLRAWADDPKPLMETKRREAIARANRLETFYRMLETENLHFRFEPGPLPSPRPGAADQEGDEPWGQGLPVEYMLLEHARLSDESGGGDLEVDFYDIPRALDPSRFAPDVRDFLQECDGRSTLQEIADRLGWPLRQCHLNVLEHYRSGAIRLAQPRELLAAAQSELEAGRVGRAATRLSGWVRASMPGPLSVGDAELFTTEWDAGRLQLAFRGLEPRDARAILRRLDRVHVNSDASLERWQALAAEHRGDDVTQLHTAALRLAAADEPDSRSFTDLLRLARSFQEQGNPARTRTLLRLASYQLPAKPQTRTELGKRMLETGLVEEGTRWLLDVARELIDKGDGERSMGPIRTVLKKLPDHAGGHGLLIEARALVARKKRRRWKSIVALSLLLVFSMAGLVQLQVNRKAESHQSEIRDALTNPDQALKLLNEYFPDDDSSSIQALRSKVNAAKKEFDDRKEATWLERYKGIEQECEYGDPLLGLKRALELDDPPKIASSRKWPGRVELLAVLTARIETRQEELNVSFRATIAELHAEERLQSLLGELLALSAQYKDELEVSAFHFRLDELYEEIEERREVRAQLRDEDIKDREEKEQDILLGAARSHGEAGDLERSVATYERLMATESFDELRPLLEAEIAAVQKHYHAVLEATSLAEAGEHEAALERLAEGCPNDPGEHLLPWRVTSFPDGARVTFPNGESRVTPFTTTSSPGERLKILVEREGFEPRRVQVTDPDDRTVYLNRRPERELDPEHRVQALPVPVGDDHIIADRKGRLLRLDAKSRTKWTKILDTLGGVARTPVFLPRRPGFLLVISEDGRCWLVDAASGRLQGPLDLDAPPKDGPALTRHGVWLRLENGRIAIWDDQLQPNYHEPNSSFLGADASAVPADELVPSSFAFLRRHAHAGNALVAPETGWTAEVREAEIIAYGKDGRGFTARRNGEWEYIAWEAPKALLPYGRLWVADEDGLRCYRPDAGPMLQYDR